MAVCGCLCFAYYFAMVISSKRWNTTFSGFWVALGVGFLVSGRIWAYLPEGVKFIIAAAAVLTVGAVAFVEWKLIRAMRAEEPERLEWMIVLGAQVRGTRVTDSLRRRLDRAVQYYNGHPGTRIIVSGGQGNGEEISEAAAMAAYLQEKQVPAEMILLEDTSVSTYENLVNSGKIIGTYEEAEVGIVTNNFHIYRALKLAENLGYKNVHGIAASTKAIVLPNYMMREFFAEGKRMLHRR